MNHSTTEENRIEERALKRKLVPIVLTMGVLLIALLFAFQAISGLGWFANNKNLTAENMRVTLNNGMIELAFDDAPASASFVYPFADNARQSVKLSEEGYEKENEEHDHVTTDLTPKLRMVLKNDDPDADTIGDVKVMSPGSYGTLTFYIIPKRGDITSVNLSFALRGLGMVTDETATPPTSSFGWVEDDEALSFIEGHILFFTGLHGTYSGRIDGNYEYVFADHVSDKTTVAGEDRYAVNVYWVWPKTFSQMAFSEGSFLHIRQLFSSHEVDLLREEMHDDPDKFFRYVGTETPDDYEDLMERLEADPSQNYSFIALSDGYNNADQFIGENVEFLVLTIDADAVVS